MTSVRTCYCKHEGNAARKKDNDITMHNGNRRPATAVSKRSIVTNRICGDGRKSCKGARRVTKERYEGTLNTNRSVEAQPPNLELSPETSIALENAEKIINNAKIQLMEVCATSSFDSVQRNRNTYSDEPPLDDEMEERLYVRELVASKFHDACSSRLSEENGKASARSEKNAKRDFPRVTVRRVDLSAPKFRASRRRRRADWSSLGYGSDDRSRGRASPSRVPSSDSGDSIAEEEVANETTARDDRARERRRTLSALGNTCEIQIGPSVHIVDRELTRQDLEDVHISPESSRARSRANTATYTLHHDVIQSVNDSEGTPRTRRVRLDRENTLQREKPIGKLFMEAVTEAARTNPESKSEKDLEKVRYSDSGRDNGQIESPKVRIYRQERRDEKRDPRDAEELSERLKNVTSQGAAKFAVIVTPRTDRSEKLRSKAGNVNHAGIANGGDTEIRCAEDGGIFCARSDADRPRDDENIVDKIRAEESQGDRSEPSPAGDTSIRKTGFPPRRENITSLCREAESPAPYRTIDGHFSRVFNSHDGRDELRNDASEDLNLNEIDLYRPRLDDLDSILHSNDRKIERVARLARNLSELLSGPEFAMYRLDEDERVTQDVIHEQKLCRDSSADKDDERSSNEPAARSSILEIELRYEDLTVSETRRTDGDPIGTNAGSKSSVSRSNYSRNSVESSVFPASDASDEPRTSRDSRDKAQRSAKGRLSGSSMDRSGATTFSNLVPALSSTHTDPQTCRPREEEVARGDCHADAKSRVTSASELIGREIRRSAGKECTDGGIYAQLSRQDTSQATDRFVTYILQDEKRSVEGKVAGALKESSVTPAAVQKLLDHLREAESIRDARQTETLDILRDILINVKSQPDQGNANGRETSSRDIPDFSARTKVPSIKIGELTSREEEARQARAKIDASEMGRIARDSCVLEGPGGHFLDFSECRETRESARSTARCESARKLCSENNNRGDTGLTESADVAKAVSIGAKNQTDKGVDGYDLKKEETLPRNVADPLIQTSATSDAIEGAVLRTRARNDTSDTGLIAGKSKDSENPDKYLSVSRAFPETKESVRSAAHFELARGSKNSGENNSKGNSEAESLKRIPDYRSDDENLGENSKHLSAKIASARSREERETEAADSVAALPENKEDDANNERLGEDETNVVRANKDQDTNQIIMQTDQVIDAQSDIPEEAVKEIRGGKTRDIVTPVDKKVLFALSEVSEIRKERARSDASPVRSKLIDEASTKTDVNLVYSSTKEDTGSSRESEIDPRHPAVKEKIDPADHCSADPPRDRIVSSVKSSESSLQEVASRDKRISLDIAGEDNLTRDMGNEEFRKSMTFATVENRRDGNEISGLWKTGRSDNERQLIDLTKRRRNYKIDVLSSSNSSVSSTLLDHDGRSVNGMSSANARRIGTTPETSHSEGELYMPSSCSYSLGEVRVLRKRRDLIEDNAMDRDSSMTVLVTRSMLTSLNDSTVSLLESSGRV